MRGRYAAQARMSQLSDGASSPRILISGLFLIELVWLVVGGGLYGLIHDGLLQNGTSVQAILSLLSTVVLWLVVAVVLRRMQGRSWRSFIAPFETASFDFFSVVWWSGGIMLTLTLLGILPFLDQASFARPLWQWLLVLPFALVAVFIQTTGEELYFRGFLQSTLAARFDSPWVWAVLPSLAFGLVHIPNASHPAEAVQIVIYITAFGFFAADLTARTGTLGAAMAFHFTHNIMVFTIFTYDTSPEAGLALWLFADPAAGLAPDEAPSFDAVMAAQTLYMLMELTIFWLAARVAVRA